MGDFEKYGLPGEVLENLSRQKIEYFLPVQERTLEPARSGRNILVQSPTGSGKTLAYLLPVLAQVDPEVRGTQALVMVPTRELAAQVGQVLGSIKPPGLGHGVFIGGTNMARQKDKLKEKPAVVVGTPGRLEELIREGKLKTAGIRQVVVDEADKLAEEKFRQEVEGLLNLLPSDAQYLFFSATVSRESMELMDRLELDYENISMSRKKVNQDIDHWFIMAEDARKFGVLKALEKTVGIPRALIFITRNAGVEGLARRLTQQGFAAAGLHSGMSSADRRQLMSHFRSGKINYLVTTDILARGMDVPGVDYVINYDVPKDVPSYVHRAGRTARAGRKGVAVTLVEEQKKFVIRKFERKLKIVIQEKGISTEGELVDVHY